MNIPIGEYLLPQKPLVPARPYFACVGSDPLWFRYGDGGCDKELLARPEFCSGRHHQSDSDVCLGQRVQTRPESHRCVKIHLY